MLKDNLLKIATEQSTKTCKLGNIYKSLDKETKNALVEALRSEATTMDICRALNADGIRIGREFLGSKRVCFKTGAPTCCLYPINGEGK